MNQMKNPRIIFTVASSNVKFVVKLILLFTAFCFEVEVCRKAHSVIYTILF